MTYLDEYGTRLLSVFIAKANQSLDAINRVRELHKPNEYNECAHCLQITELGGYDYLSSPTVEYPCETIQALDGESNDQD